MSIPVTDASAPARNRVYLDHHQTFAIEVMHQVDPCHFSAERAGCGQGKPLGFGVEKATFGSAAQRHIRTPVAGPGVPAHHSQHRAAEHENAEIMPGMPHHTLEIEN